MLAPNLLVAAAAVVCFVASLAPRRQRELSITGALLLVSATFWLATEFMRGRFVLLYVIDNARADGSLVERIGGLWAGPQGSLLLFVTVMAVWLGVAQIGQGWSLNVGRGERIANALVASLALVVVALASPFELSPQPLDDGTGLTPILEHPAMAFHPPILYAGLTGLIVTGLRSGLDGLPAKLARLALALATLGLISGSRWAFSEVGWGGYWAWDPIENGGLIATLLAAAALHSPNRFRPALWVASALAGVWATTITRVGVIGSVHAFADEPALRYALLAVSVGVSVLGLFALRRQGNAAAGVKSSVATSVMVLLSVLIGVGTYRPLIGWVVGESPSIVAGRFFSLVSWLPAMIAAVALARRKFSLVAGAIAAIAMVLLAGSGGAVWSYLLIVAGAFAAGSAVIELSERPSALAHLGVGVLLAGIGGTTMDQTETVTVSAGETIEFAGAQFEHIGIDLVTGLVGSTADSNFVLDGKEMTASIRTLNLRGRAVSEAATRLGVRGEYLIVFQDGNRDGARYRLTYLPLLPLVWLGGLLAAFGFVMPKRWASDGPSTSKE